MDEWVERYGDVLYRFALARVQNTAVAEDLVQETFVAVLKAQKSFRKQSSPQTWLVGILKHKIIDHFRKSYRTISIEETTILETDGEDSPGGKTTKIPVKNWEASAESLVENGAFREALKKCLDQLPEKSRRLFLLREVDEVGSEELCKNFDLTPTNLWVIFHRIRNRLKDCLQKDWFKG